MCTHCHSSLYPSNSYSKYYQVHVTTRLYLSLKKNNRTPLDHYYLSAYYTSIYIIMARERLNKEWTAYRETALEKLPDNIREVYRKDWWSPQEDAYDSDDEECIPRLVSLVQSVPTLTVRDIFAICETTISNVEQEDLNVPMIPYEGADRMEKVKSLALQICDMRFQECTKNDEYHKQHHEGKYQTKQRHYVEIQELRIRAESNELDNLDPVFRMLRGPCTLQMACLRYFAPAFWSDSIQSNNITDTGGKLCLLYSNVGDCEQCPMMTMLIYLGLATIDPVMFMDG